MRARLAKLEASGAFLFLLFMAGFPAETPAGDPQKPAPKEWQTPQTVHLKGYKVSLSAPIPVAQSEGYLWLPTIALLASGDLVVLMSDHKDACYYPNTGVASFSKDGGLTWSKPSPDQHHGYVHLRLPSEDEIFLPFYMARTPDGIGAPYNLIRKGRQTLELMESAALTGLPGQPATAKTENGNQIAGFVFDGQTVRLKDGKYFATLYGACVGSSMGLIGAQSADGVHWKMTGFIAKRAGPVNTREEGPTEAAVCRLADGRLMCIYRTGSYFTYGQTWSSDEGKTWSEAVECRGPKSVEPSLVVLNSGAVALSGGRPGLKLWINNDGRGKDWQEINMGQNHNRCHPGRSDTMGYTEIVATDDSHLLYVYDSGRLSAEHPQGQVWVVRVALEKTDSK